MTHKDPEPRRDLHAEPTTNAGVPVPDNAALDAAALAAEFPGWKIDSPAPASGHGSTAWRASRETGRSGPMTLAASSAAGLRILLDEIDAGDCRQAAYDLCGALRARGVRAESQGVSVATQTRTGILRVVTARRGVFIWSVTGTEIGSIDDPAGAADRIVRELDRP